MLVVQESFPGGWVVARTKPQRENYAKENVIRQGFEPYLPIAVEATTQREGPLFPGYLFVYATASWVWLRSTFGVLDVVLGSRGLPARVGDGVIQALRARENSQGLVQLMSFRFRPQQKVNFVAGRFAGFSGLYQDTPAPKRVRVLMDILGAMTPVEVSDRSIEAA